MLKTVSNLSLGFHVFGMINACNFIWGISPASNSQRMPKRGHLFMGMIPMLNTVSNISLGFPEYGRINVNNLRWGFPMQGTQVRKRKLIEWNDVNNKNVAKCSQWGPMSIDQRVCK